MKSYSQIVWAKITDSKDIVSHCLNLSVGGKWIQRAPWRRQVPVAVAGWGQCGTSPISLQEQRLCCHWRFLSVCNAGLPQFLYSENRADIGWFTTLQDYCHHVPLTLSPDLANLSLEFSPEIKRNNNISEQSLYSRFLWISFVESLVCSWPQLETVLWLLVDNNERGVLLAPGLERMRNLEGDVTMRCPEAWRIPISQIQSLPARVAVVREEIREIPGFSGFGIESSPLPPLRSKGKLIYRLRETCPEIAMSLIRVT